jgi:hypothetical protein
MTVEMELNLDLDSLSRMREARQDRFGLVNRIKRDYGGLQDYGYLLLNGGQP